MAQAIINDEFFDVIKKLIVSLGPSMEHIVFVGGFANALYEYYEEAQESGLGDIITKDIDLLTDIKHKSPLNIKKKLEDGGFYAELKGNKKVGLTKFYMKRESGNFEIEFLCPLYGGERDREGNSKDIQKVDEGVTAQSLRYMDLPLYNNIELSTERVPQLTGLNNKLVLPSPGAYLIQKFIVIEKRRGREEKEKDYMYCFELLMKFRSNLNFLAKDVHQVMLYNASRGKKYKKVKSFLKDFREKFNDINSVGVLAVERELKRRREPTASFEAIERDEIFVMFSSFIEELSINFSHQ